MMLRYSLYPVKGCIVGRMVVVGREKGEGRGEKGEGMNKVVYYSLVLYIVATVLKVP